MLRLLFRAGPFTSTPFTTILFFTETATTEIYTLSLHDALPILIRLAAARSPVTVRISGPARSASRRERLRRKSGRSEEHTSELQSHSDLVCRLLLEKKKNQNKTAQDTRIDTMLLVEPAQPCNCT